MSVLNYKGWQANESQVWFIRWPHDDSNIINDVGGGDHLKDDQDVF